MIHPLSLHFHSRPGDWPPEAMKFAVLKLFEGEPWWRKGGGGRRVEGSVVTGVL